MSSLMMKGWLRRTFPFSRGGLIPFADLVLILFSLFTYSGFALEEGIFFQIDKPIKLSYIYQINPSYHIGAPFPDYPMENVAMVYAEPDNGCQEFTTDVKDEVVLIERGDCPFINKVVNAERAGAKIAIVTDSASGADEFIDMISDGEARRSSIPAAYLPGVSGRRIREYLLYEKPVVYIDIPLNYTSKPLEVYNKPPWELW